MLDMISGILLTALYTAFLQNLVFSRMFGASEAVRVSFRPGSFLSFAVMISGFSIASSMICYPLFKYEIISAMPTAMHVAVYAAVLAIIYVAVALIANVVLGASKSFMTTLGISALNTMVLSIPFVNRTAAYSFTECIGAGLGSGIAFVFASALIAVGVKKITQNSSIPEVFKGSPATFLYVGILSLAFVGFSGGSF